MTHDHMINRLTFYAHHKFYDILISVSNYEKNSDNWPLKLVLWLFSTIQHLSHCGLLTLIRVNIHAGNDLSPVAPFTNMVEL